MYKKNSIGRRSVLFGFMGTALAAALPLPIVRAAGIGTMRLRSGAAKAGLLGGDYPPTDVWAYNGRVPGPELRFRQGERLAVEFENQLEQPSTVHWHGLRLPNAMDGVPGLTQPPVAPGETFPYAFDLPDAGTFWYHPHVKSSEQIGRGLYGPLIVEETNAPVVDRDVVWVLDDWRLQEDGSIDPSFHEMHDMSHSGRLGNVASLNGVSSESFSVRSGERLRLRLINAANARSFALSFEGHTPWVVALDGQPVKPFAPKGGRVELGSGQRADLIIDMTGKPGETFSVTDTYYARSAYEFLTLDYEASAPIRESLLDGSIELAKNPIPTPDPAGGRSNPYIVTGGAMGGMREASYQGQNTSIQDLVGHGKVWAVNGVVYDPNHPKPMFTFEQGSTQRIVFRNDTAWPHPIHLHGHVFQILSRNGKKAEIEIWSDTVFLQPEETVEVIFVADNPGDWLFHCHVLEHHEAGMATSIRVV